MFNTFSLFFSKKIVGIDIGTDSVKVVELSEWGGSKRLKNYGEVKSVLIPKKPLPNSKISQSGFLNSYTSEAIKEILKEAGIKTKSAIFSVPDFYTFCTSFDIPSMSEKEIPDAIRYNASQYITLPISEVTLDWKIISNSAGVNNSLMKIFIVAIPNKIINDYREVATRAGLELCALEAEAFSVVRALVRDNRKTVCLLDMGAQSSTINIVDQGFLKSSYSSNFGSNQIAKNNPGDSSQLTGEALKASVDPFLVELKNIYNDFLNSEKKQIEEVYLSGGMTNIPGLKDYISKNIQKPIFTPNCFSGIMYPVVLDNSLKEMNPRFSVAVGAALNGLDM